MVIDRRGIIKNNLITLFLCFTIIGYLRQVLLWDCFKHRFVFTVRKFLSLINATVLFIAKPE